MTRRPANFSLDLTSIIMEPESNLRPVRSSTG